jgi:hypothetical protein
MRDSSVVLLVLVLSSLLLDTLLGKWLEWRGTNTGGGAGRSSRLVAAVAQGVVVAVILYLFERSWLPALLAGGAFALVWGALRSWLAGVRSAFSTLLLYLVPIAAMIIIWLSVEGYWHWLWSSGKDLANSRNLSIVLAYVLIMRPSSALIGAVLTPWLDRVKDENSLKNAGAMIGYLERMLILSFVLLDQWGAIGFLLTAKSILRFNDLKGDGQRSMSEYVLLGTLLSFTVSIAVGLAALKLAAT